MKRLRPMKPLPRVSRREVVQMVRHFERRAIGAATAAELASRRRLNRSEGKKRSWTDVASVKEALELSNAIHQAGLFTEEEFFFHCVVPVEHLHEHLWIGGHYKERLDPISNKLREVEAEYELKPGEFWPKGQGPAEYDRLNAQYEKVLDDEFGKLLREVGLDTHSKLWRQKRAEFDRLREAGRASTFEKSDIEHATAKLIGMFETEATKCAKAKAYYAACVMIGSASEARLLLKCLQDPTELAAAKAKIPATKGFHKGGPEFWNLSQLIEIANQAGWVANLQTENVVIHIVNLLSHLHDMRNLVHPGRHAVRRPHVSIGKEQYADAKAAYSALCFSLERAEHRGRE
jgi:hypothetical protein